MWLFLVLVLLLILVLKGGSGNNTQDVCLDETLTSVNFDKAIVRHNIQYENASENNRFYSDIDNDKTSLVYDLSDLEKKLMNHIMLYVSPQEGTADTSVIDDWIGPTDGTDDGTDDLWSTTPNWHTDHVAFVDMTDILLKATKLFVNIIYPDTYLNDNLKNIINTTFLKIFRSIDDWTYKANSFPWGQNWYQFCVSCPTNIIYSFYYFASVGKKYQEEVLAYRAGYVRYVDKIFQSPRRALGWERTGSNAVLMGMPFCVGHLWKGDLDTVDKTDDFKYMMDQSNIHFVVQGEGLRPDYGWIFHTNVRAFGYLGSTYWSATINNLLGYINNYGDVYNYVSGIMSHPTINANLPGLFARTPAVKRYMGTAGKYGIFLQFSCMIVSAKYKRYFFQVSGMINNMAFYESDALNNAEITLWAMMREMWVLGDGIRQYDPTKNIQYVPGNISQTEKFSINLWPTANVTTTSFAETGTSASAVLKLDENTAVFANFTNNADYKDYKLADNLAVYELQFITEHGRICVLSGSSEMYTIGEVGIIDKKISDTKYKLTNGKIFNCILGTIYTEEVEFSIMDAYDENKFTTETHTVIKVKSIPNSDGTLNNVSYQVSLDENWEVDNIRINRTSIYPGIVTVIDHYILAFSDPGFLSINANTQEALFQAPFNGVMSSRQDVGFNYMSLLMLAGVTYIPIWRKIKNNTETQYHSFTVTPEDNLSHLSYYVGDYNFQLQMKTSEIGDLDSISLTTGSVIDKLSAAWFGGPENEFDTVENLSAKYPQKEVPADDWETFTLDLNKSVSSTNTSDSVESIKLQTSRNGLNRPILRALSDAKNNNIEYVEMRAVPTGVIYMPLDENLYYDGKFMKPYNVVLNAPADVNGDKPVAKVVVVSASGSGEEIDFQAIVADKTKSVSKKRKTKSRSKLTKRIKTPAVDVQS